MLGLLTIDAGFIVGEMFGVGLLVLAWAKGLSKSIGLDWAIAGSLIFLAGWTLAVANSL